MISSDSTIYGVVFSDKKKGWSGEEEAQGSKLLIKKILLGKKKLGMEG